VSFKNQRIVGGRALVLDAFTNTLDGSKANQAAAPGWGVFAHRDGYDVLAGDGHAAWMGDPQSRHMYWHKLEWTLPEPSYSDTMGSFASAGGWSAMSATRVGAGAWAWHQFDVFLGVDVGVGFQSQSQ
jgi:hypothetical protein